MSRFQKRRIVAFPLLLLAVGVSFFVGFIVRDTQNDKQAHPAPKTRQPSPPPFESGIYTVAFVIDGDTVELTNGTRVRYAGIDAPEHSERFGASSTDANKKFVERKEIYLEISEEKQDIYGRTLGFVWLNDILINERLVEEGFARVFYFGNMKKPKYYDRFMTAQESARKGLLGLWRREP